MKRADFETAAFQLLARTGNMSSNELITAISAQVGEQLNPNEFCMRIKYLETERSVTFWEGYGRTKEEKENWRGRQTRYYSLTETGRLKAQALAQN